MRIYAVFCCMLGVVFCLASGFLWTLYTVVMIKGETTDSPGDIGIAALFLFWSSMLLLGSAMAMTTYIIKKGLTRSDYAVIISAMWKGKPPSQGTLDKIVDLLERGE